MQAAAAATDGTDAELVAAGWLHDAVEDGATTAEELTQKFSERVASLVVEVTDDMTLPKSERRQRQVIDAPHKSADARLIKIADKISNIRGRILPEPTPDQRDELSDYTAWAVEVVSGCRGGNAFLDDQFDEAVAQARSTL